MRPVPDGDTTADHAAGADRGRRSASPAAATIVLGVLPESGRCASATCRPHRCPRRLTRSAPRSTPPGGAIRFDEFMRPRAVRRARLLHAASDGPGDAATSSRRPRSGRCSARWSPGSSTPSGRGSGDPIRSRSSRPAPGRARWPVRSSRRRAACRDALRYVAVEVSAAQRELHPAGVESVATDARRAVSTGSIFANELLDNLPFRLLVYDGGWREALVASDADGSFVEVLATALASAVDGLPVPARARCAGARAARRRRVGRVGGRGLLGDGRVVAVDYGSTTAQLADAPVAGVAAHVPRQRARRALPARPRGPRTSPPRWRVDQLPRRPIA